MMGKHMQNSVAYVVCAYDGAIEENPLSLKLYLVYRGMVKHIPNINTVEWDVSYYRVPAREGEHFVPLKEFNGWK